MRGATVGDQVRPQSELISIHAPLAGCDLGLEVPINRHGISIHAPRAGRDSGHEGAGGPDPDFNPRAPCGARRTAGDRMVRHWDFNPRAPCGARPYIPGRLGRGPEFQSTRPMRGATTCHSEVILDIDISIHAPHAGRDGPGSWPCPSPDYFNPRAPCGARLVPGGYCAEHQPFQSTRPMRGATDANRSNA